jgi:RNA polymerase sigma factor (sigma-70 family)
MSHQHTSGGKRTPPQSEAERLAELEPLVRREVNAARRRYPWADPDDLFQWGVIGLLKAMRSTSRDPDRPFEPFAMQAIRHEIRSSPEVKRGVNRVLLARTSQAHDSLMAAGHRRPQPAQIAGEANRLEALRAARLQRAPLPNLTSTDVEHGLQMLAVASPESVEAMLEMGREPPLGDADPGGRLPPNWFDAFAKVADAMIDDCGLSKDKSFVLRHLVFGTTLGGIEATTSTVSEALGTSEENIRVLKHRARRAVEERVAACLEELGSRDDAPALSCLILLAAYQDEVRMTSSVEAEEILVNLHAAVQRGVRERRSPEWLLQLLELLLVFIRKIGAP